MTPFRRTCFGPDYRYAERDARPERISGSPTSPLLTAHIIIIPKTDRILADPLARKCLIEPNGSDWHIKTKSQAECDAIVGLLKLNRVHGIIRRSIR